MVPSFRFNLFSLFLFPFGSKSATIFNHARNFNAPPLTEPDLKISLIRLFSKTHTTDDSVYKLYTILGCGSGYWPGAFNTCLRDGLEVDISEMGYARGEAIIL